MVETGTLSDEQLQSMGENYFLKDTTTFEVGTTTVEPDLAQKHTLYALAWSIIQLPPQDWNIVNHQERVRIKRACRAYARARGWSLELANFANGAEQWSLWGGHNPVLFGTLQECCLRIVEHDLWPEGKPKEDNPTS